MYKRISAGGEYPIPFGFFANGGKTQFLIKVHSPPVCPGYFQSNRLIMNQTAQRQGNIFSSSGNYCCHSVDLIARNFSDAQNYLDFLWKNGVYDTQSDPSPAQPSAQTLGTNQYVDAK